jgi:sugar O-acyltransferase (sialic acid O-acetyltransferase NeuD family)
MTPISLVDKSARLCRSASIGSGVQIMPGAFVHNDARIGRQCLINTCALIEHDCVLEDGVEIGPGAVLAGRVHVGANSWVCTGASVAPRIRIGKNSIVGAGAVVIDDIPDGVVAVGTPAKPLPGKTTPSSKAHPVQLIDQ